MTLFDNRNPSGKAVACSMIALCLVVCAPALIAYLDGQAVDFSTVWGSEDPEAYDDILEFRDSSVYLVPSVTGGDFVRTFTYTSAPVANYGTLWYYLNLASPAFDDVVERIVLRVGSDMNVNQMNIQQADGSAYIVRPETVSTGEDCKEVAFVFDSLVRHYISTAEFVNFSLTLKDYVYSEENATFEHQFSISFLNSKELVPFETILIVTGILLIVAAIYATPYVSFGDVTRWGEKGVRGAYAGGKKMINNRRK